MPLLSSRDEVEKKSQNPQNNKDLEVSVPGVWCYHHMIPQEGCPVGILCLGRTPVPQALLSGSQEGTGPGLT